MSCLNNQRSKKTSIFNLKFSLSAWRVSRIRSQGDDKLPTSRIPDDAKEIKEVKIGRVGANGDAYLPPPDGILLPINENPQSAEKVYQNEMMVVQVGYVGDNFQLKKDTQTEKQNLLASDKISPDGKSRRTEKEYGQVVGQQLVVHGQEAQEGMPQLDKCNHILAHVGDSKGSSDGEIPALVAADTPEKGSNLSGDGSPVDSPALPEVSHLGWGHCYTLQELEAATDGFAEANVLEGEGQREDGIIYRGQLADGTLIAVTKLLNNRGQAEKHFRVVVDAIGRVGHKNLVRLLGYCAEGAAHRILVYEYVDNGTLQQWLHGPLANFNALNWDARMKIVTGTAKGLAYLHEALEPKVVHRAVHPRSILLDVQWNARISSFGSAMLLGSGKSDVITDLVGTFGYVDPEYAFTGLVNTRTDVYSFGVLLMVIITGRLPVADGRPGEKVFLGDWIKMMVGSRRSEEVADPRLDLKPSSRALKRALLVAFRCVDSDFVKRPKMGEVVHMLEAEDFPFEMIEELSGLCAPEEPILDRRIIRDVRSRRTDSLSQDVKTDSSTSKGELEGSDNSVDSPRNLSYVKKYSRLES